MTQHHLFVTEQQKEMLQELISLQYYSHEFAGNTWDGMPPELVAKGLKGLEDFIRIMDWSINKRDPYSVEASEDIPF
jgi:hypothetical protein